MFRSEFVFPAWTLFVAAFLPTLFASTMIAARPRDMIGAAFAQSLPTTESMSNSVVCMWQRQFTPNALSVGHSHHKRFKVQRILRRLKLRDAIMSASNKRGSSAAEHEDEHLNLVAATTLVEAYGDTRLRAEAVSTQQGHKLRGLVAHEELKAGEYCAQVPLAHTLSVPFRLGDDPWYCEMAVRLLAVQQGCCSEDGDTHALTKVFADDLIKSVEFEPCVEPSWLFSDSHPRFRLLCEVLGVEHAMALREYYNRLSEQAERCLDSSQQLMQGIGRAPTPPEGGMLPVIQTCMRRAFLNDEQGSVHLLPVLDLANHPPTGLPNVRAEFGQGPDADFVKFRCLENIAAGCEVFNDYGGDDGAVFVLTHGFSPLSLRSEVLFIAQQSEIHDSAGETGPDGGSEEESGRPRAAYAPWGVPAAVFGAWKDYLLSSEELESPAGGDAEMVKKVLGHLREVAEGELARLEAIQDRSAESDQEKYLDGLIRSRIHLLEAAVRALALQERIGRHIAPPPEIFANDAKSFSTTGFWASQREEGVGYAQRE